MYPNVKQKIKDEISSHPFLLSLCTFSLVIIFVLGIYASVANKESNNTKLKYDELNNNYTALQTEHQNLNDEYLSLKNDSETLSASLSKAEENYKELKAEFDEYINKNQDYKKFNDKENQLSQLETKINNNKSLIAEQEQQISDNATIITSAKTEEQRKLTEGTTVYEDNYVKINYLRTDYEYNRILGDYALIFLVENKTNYVITIQADSLAFDGNDLGNITMSSDISPQSKGKAYAYVDDIGNTDMDYISGQLRVVDFSQELINISYSARFVNIQL